MAVAVQTVTIPGKTGPKGPPGKSDINVKNGAKGEPRVQGPPALSRGMTEIYIFVFCSFLFLVALFVPSFSTLLSL